MRGSIVSKRHFYPKMDLKVYIQLIFLCVVNIIFTFSGILLNSLVIACFLKSSQLRKKLCNFMIMVLSCFDLLAVITNHPLFALYVVVWSTEDYDLLHKLEIYTHFSDMFLGFSFLALLVMNIERYLGVYYPIFHRASVTRHRLLTLLAISLILPLILQVTLTANNLVISSTETFSIFMSIVFPPFLFINYKLFKISRKVRRINAISPEKRTTINLKSIHTCLLTVACLVIMSISSIFFIVFSLVENSTTTNARLSLVWSSSVWAMNSTFNSLIFFWKNKVLRTEGVKILKTLKYRIFGSQADQ